MNNTIELIALTKIYRPPRRAAIQALAGIGLTIGAGEIVALLGARGAGKTTLLRVLAGRLTPTGGQAWVGGHDVVRERAAARLLIGLAAQAPLSSRRDSAWKLLLRRGRAAGMAGPELASGAERLLRDLDLWDERFEPLACLARGAAQRLALAAALAPDRPIALLDEPALDLDDGDIPLVAGWLRSLAADGKTIVFAAERPALALALATRVVVLRQGGCLADSATADLLPYVERAAYQIRVRGQLPDDWADWFDGFSLSNLAGGEALLRGHAPDQAALHGALAIIRNLGLPLLGVARVEADLESLLAQLAGHTLE